MDDYDFSEIRKRALAQAKKRDKEVAKAIAQGASEYKYFDIQKHWRKLKPIAESPAARVILDRDMRKYAVVRQMEHDAFMSKQGHKNYSSSLNYAEGIYPFELDSCDWRFGKRGPRPDYWRFTCHSACHWLVNLALHIARTAYPKREWQVITSIKHSTVIDMASKTFFDLNWLAIGVSVEECYANTVGMKHRLLPVGQELFLHN